MELKKLVQVTAIMSAVSGLYGCSGDENVDINIATEVTEIDGSTDGSTDGSDVSCPESFSFERTVDGQTLCQLNGNILTSETLTEDITWYLAGAVVVGNGNQEMSAVDGVLADDDGTVVTEVTLTIEAGTQILAESGSFANLTITRGSSIEAVGTADAPIVFSSDDDGEDGSGEWGGIIIHGYGLHNVCRYIGDGGDDEPTEDVACNVDSEGESGFAGGHDNTDSSGSLEYVVVTEGGFEFAVGNEINGISFVAVGSGTTFENIQVNGNADDGVEFYGGAVNAKYLVLTGNNDDSIDWDEGYIGNIQYAFVRQADGAGDFTVEADTEGSDRFLSQPTLANVTFISSAVEGEAHNLKASTGGYFMNSVIASRDGAALSYCVVLDGTGAHNNAMNGDIVYENIVADCVEFENSDVETADVFMTSSILDTTTVSLLGDITFDADTWAVTDAEATGLVWMDPSMFSDVADNDFFDETTYAGAVDPDAMEAWWEGWVVEGSTDP